MARRQRSRKKSNRREIICVYCGPSGNIPRGYDRKGESYECLRKGVGVGVYAERRKWQKNLGLPIPEYKSPCPRKIPFKKRA